MNEFMKLFKDWRDETRKGKDVQKAILFTKYRWKLLQQLMAMSKYGNLPFRKEFIERELLSTGFVVAVKTNEGKILVGSASSIERDEFGMPKPGSTIDFFTRREGHQGTYIVGETAVFGYNNSIRTPVLDIDWIAKQFTEIDTSIEVNVQHSRVSGIPVARTEKIKKTLDNLIADIRAGVTKSVAGDNLLDAIKEGNADPLTILHLTQPEQIQNVQYLSKLYDDLLRRFWNDYGHSMNSTGKMAQVNEMELEGYETYSMIVPDDMLDARKEFVDEVNKTFGTSWTVEYSRGWKHLIEQQPVTPEEVEEIQELQPEEEQPEDPKPEEENEDKKEDEENG